LAVRVLFSFFCLFVNSFLCFVSRPVAKARPTFLVPFPFGLGTCLPSVPSLPLIATWYVPLPSNVLIRNRSPLKLVQGFDNLPLKNKRLLFRLLLPAAMRIAIRKAHSVLSPRESLGSLPCSPDSLAMRARVQGRSCRATVLCCASPGSRGHSGLRPVVKQSSRQDKNNPVICFACLPPVQRPEKGPADAG